MSPAILSWALKRHSKEELEKKFPKLEEWRRGESKPTLSQLERFAAATHTPFGYFFLPKPPIEPLPIPYYRTLDATSPEPSDDLLETVRTMTARQDWLHDYLKDQGAEKLDFVSSITLSTDTEEAGKSIRAKLGIADHWSSNFKQWTEALKDLVTKLEELGVFVVSNGVVGNNTHRSLDPKEFRGFVLVDDLAPLIFVNGADSKAAQMFTLAHEIAHIWLGKSAAFDLRDLSPSNDATELKCNAIAAEVLVPRQILLQMWQSSKKRPTFEELAKYFKVSQIVAARRVLDLKLISKNEFLQFYRNYLEQDSLSSAASKTGGGDFYATQNQRIGKRFALTVFSAVRQNKLLYRDAYRLTGLTGKTFDSYFDRLLK